MHISFSEILLVLLVALFVIKPERLPGIATILGRWVRHIQQMVAKIKNDVEKPLEKYSYHQEGEVDKGSSP